MIWWIVFLLKIERNLKERWMTEASYDFENGNIWHILRRNYLHFPQAEIKWVRSDFDLGFWLPRCNAELTWRVCKWLLLFSLSESSPLLKQGHKIRVQSILVLWLDEKMKAFISLYSRDDCERPYFITWNSTSYIGVLFWWRYT